MSFSSYLSARDSSEEVPTHNISITIETVIGLRPKCNQPKMHLGVYFNNAMLYGDQIPYTNRHELNKTITVSVPVGFRAEYEKYMSNPLVFVVTETENVQEIVEVKETGDATAGVAAWRSEESVLELQRALLGVKEVPEKGPEKAADNVSLVPSEKKAVKSTVGSKTSSKMDKKDEVGKKKHQKVDGSGGSKSLGVGVMDLAPLIFGETEIKEAVLLETDHLHYLDDRMFNESKLPRIEVRVEIDQPIADAHLIAITVESVYNIPQSMSGSSFRLAVTLPIGEPLAINFSNFKLEAQPKPKFTKKKWFGTDYKTAYSVEGDLATAKGNADEKAEYPRMECNAIKRVFCTSDDIEAFIMHIRKNHSLSAELGVDFAGGKERRSKGLLVDEPLRECSVHAVASMDLRRLLYPGESRVRAVCPLSTFNHDETKKTTAKAHFPSSGGDLQREESDKKRSPRGSRHKESRTDARSKYALHMQRLSETNCEINLDDSSAMFVVIEVELDKPIVAKRGAEELEVNCRELLEELPELPKYVKSKDVTGEMYKQCIVRLMKDIKVQHVKFVQENRKIGTEKDFLQFLEETGVYQSYLTTLMTSASSYVAATKAVDPEWTPAEYQCFISVVYVELVEKMNAVVNEVFFGARQDEQSPSVNGERRLFFAHEATELGAAGLANRYLLQSITEDEHNPNVWFDYAVYNLHCGDPERALECVKSALKYDCQDSRCLLCYAVLLSQQGKLQEAETCLLSLTVSKPAWVFGWGGLYIVYSRMNNVEGMEVVVDASQKYLASARRYKTPDLAWTAEGLPQSLFALMTAYFISLRLLDEAEIMLSKELLHKDDETTQYLLAVISYYRKDYEHALLHVNKAIEFDAFNHKLFAFTGHILFAQDKTECALAEYERIFDLFTHPNDEDIYLVLVRVGLCYSKLGDSQKARQWFLRACKVTGTPYTWLCVGVLFFHQKDYLAAEECLQQSNLLDNWMPETWAYLALLNVRLKKKHEASMCLHYAEKHKLCDQQLLAQVQEEMNALDRNIDQ